ncbi:hypothetical protein TNCV_637821 [Trichonephila clavipes]|nr:hypothetical protein TNCV_637821 [Trichonephila clavipes]
MTEVSQGMDSYPEEDMDVCKCILPSQQWSYSWWQGMRGDYEGSAVEITYRPNALIAHVENVFSAEFRLISKYNNNLREELIHQPETDKKLDSFFKALIGGKDIRHRDEVNCHRLSNSSAFDAIYCCCNYNTLEELETEATISSVNRSQICPTDIIQSPSLSTCVAFDNFDGYFYTLSGKDTLHDTIGLIYQNVSDDYDIELNSSSISGNLDIPLPPTKRRRTFNEEIPELPSFNHRLQMLENLTPVKNQPSLPSNLPLIYIYIETIDLLYLLSHFLRRPNTPMWTGFNSKIIEDTSPKQKVSYLTPINVSLTNVAVVKHTMEQAQVVGNECNQTYVQVTYGMALAKTAYKIQSLSLSQRQSYNSIIFSHPSWFIPFNDVFLQIHMNFYK